MISALRNLSTFNFRKVNYSEWRQAFLAQIKQRHCLLCDGNHQESHGICKPCLADLPWLIWSCQLCGIQLPADTGTAVCGQCLRHPPLFDYCQGLFHYDFPIREVITSFKFRNKIWFARPLGELLADRILQHYHQLPDHILVPPLHKQRLRERGFNQALEIGRIVSRRTGIPLAHKALVKTRPTAHQSGLTAGQLAKNLRGSFEVRESFAHRHVLLIDDILTTGHTAQEIARVLKKAGADRVDVFCVARTPPPA